MNFRLSWTIFYNLDFVPRYVELPPFFTFRQLEEAIGWFNGDYGITDVAEYRGFLAYIDCWNYSPEPHRILRHRSWQASYHIWLRAYVSDNLPFGFASVSPPPSDFEAFPLWTTFVYRACVNSACAANLQDSSQVNADFVLALRAELMPVMVQYYYWSHAQTMPPGSLVNQWEGRFLDQHNALNKGVFRWMRALLVDFRCAHRVWKDAHGSLPSVELREAYYASRWDAYDFANYLY